MSEFSETEKYVRKVFPCVEPEASFPNIFRGSFPVLNFTGLISPGVYHGVIIE